MSCVRISLGVNSGSATLLIAKHWYCGNHGTGCPLCQKYAPTLAELERRYRERGVAFVLLNPNDSESLDDLKQAVQLHGFQGPYVRGTLRIN